VKLYGLVSFGHWIDLYCSWDTYGQVHSSTSVDWRLYRLIPPLSLRYNTAICRWSTALNGPPSVAAHPSKKASGMLLFGSFPCSREFDGTHVSVRGMVNAIISVWFFPDFDHITWMARRDTLIHTVLLATLLWLVKNYIYCLPYTDEPIIYTTLLLSLIRKPDYVVVWLWYYYPPSLSGVTPPPLRDDTPPTQWNFSVFEC